MSLSLPPRYYDKKFLHFLRHPHDFLYYDTVANRRHPNLFHFHVLWRDVIVVQHPEAIRQILVDNHRNYKKSEAFEVIEPLLGKGLLTNEGEFWKKQRRLIQPAFHKGRLEEVVRISVECTQELINTQLKNKIEPFDFAREMVALTIEIVTKTLFGANVSKDVEAIWEGMNFVNRAGIMRIRNPFQPPFWVPTPSNYKVHKTIKTINNVMFEVIANRRKAVTPASDDLLQMLLDVEDADTGERMSDKQISDEVKTLFVAGHETTVNGLTWAVYEICRNAEIYSKLKAEIAEILQGRIPNFLDLPQLKYVTCIINETLRLYPPAYAVPRQAINDDVILGYKIPANMNIVVNILALHRHPDHWDAPLTFRPERFEAIDLKGDRKHLYIPFGAGPRICIGNNFALMEMSIILVMLFQQLDFQLKDTSKVEENLYITLKPSRAVMVEVVQ